ncbi:MAG: MBL fold metallo-hydrolase [Chloroflexota bacterium]
MGRKSLPTASSPYPPLPTLMHTFTTNNNRSIYAFPVQAFPELATNIYVIDDGENLVLVDCGSGLDQSNKDLLLGFEEISAAKGISVGLADVTHIFITHGHMDHFGGLKFVREHNPQAPIGVHQLDLRVLSNYEERRIVASRRLEIFAEQAGVSAAERDRLLAMYLYAKDRYQSTPIDIIFEDGDILLDIEIHHAPGHCPGQVCFLVDDHMLTADHILGRITPHQNPESITLNTGLGTYIDALKKIKKVPGVAWALPGHEAVIGDMYARIDDIITFHNGRLDRVRDICHTPKTIVEISRELFGETKSYHSLLALEEAGAHVEYLYQRGELIAANLAEIEKTRHPVIQYLSI